MCGERIAVECVRKDRIGGQRVLAREAASELLIDLELLGAELDVLFAVIGAEEDELARLGPDAGTREHRPQRDAGPSAVAREALHRSRAVSGTLVPGGEL